jgi:prepilin-type N-terminal cleavage/methylation domain-containing protein/prepilin-type processing-associated H-X9-DG protein
VVDRDTLITPFCRNERQTHEILDIENLRAIRYNFLKPVDRKAHPLGLRRSGLAAFTLLELLVVISIIGILAALGFSALARAKAKAHAIECMNNERQLTLACLIYVDEHDDYFPYNYGYAGTLAMISGGKYYNWANNILNWDLDSYNTNSALLSIGGLGPYGSGVATMYKCPSDSVLSDRQRGAGWRNRVRTYSLNAMVGNAGEYTTGGTNINNPGYVQFFKSAQIPDPSRIFLFIEEHPDSINDGYFLNHIDDFEWYDLPAAYHNGGSEISFADGHVEYHQWQYPSTKPPALPRASGLPYDVPENERGDFQWLMDRTSIKAP